MIRISENLHNNHNVYILGAGFSRLRGLPLIADFMTQMRDALEYHARKQHKREVAAIEAVLEFRLKASSAAYRIQLDLENIEELFSLASASSGHLEDSIRLAISATLDFALAKSPSPNAQFVARRSEFSGTGAWQTSGGSGDPNQDVRWTVPAYQFIVAALIGMKSSEPSESTFISFNYDTLVESALSGLGVPFSLGFGAESSGIDAPALKVLKLHGSVNWAVPPRARTKVVAWESYRDVVDAELTPQLIPPTWKKDSRGVFEDIWQSSLAALANATRVVVLGFSIPPTDLHFKYLLAAGLKDNYSLREIVFVNPEPGMQLIQARCKELFANQTHNAAKVRFVHTRLEEFVGQGTDVAHVGAIGRRIPESVQHVTFAWS